LLLGQHCVWQNLDHLNQLLDVATCSISANATVRGWRAWLGLEMRTGDRTIVAVSVRLDWVGFYVGNANAGCRIGSVRTASPKPVGV
jgi:hypothetical protein